MRIELVSDKDPFTIWVRGDCLLDVCHKVFLGSCGANRRSDDSTCGHLKVGDQGLRTVPDVLELAQLDPTRDHRARRVLAFQRLDARFFIGAHDVSAFVVQVRRFGVQITDSFDFLVELLWVLWTVIVQPIATQMRFQVRVLLKNAPHFVERCFRQCCA